MMDGWVKVHRKIETWEWYKEPKTAHLFQHLIRRANHKDGKWKGVTVPTGCLITSIRKLSQQTGLTEMEVRTALKHLKLTHDITQSSTNKYTLIKVENYIKYQSDNTLPNNQITHRQHSDNTVITTNKNNKNEKKENNLNKNTLSGSPDCVKKIVEYLNEKAGKKYKHTTPKTKILIEKRIKEGFVIDDFKKVIDTKAKSWNGTDMEKYLRPETLFGTKFEGYLNEHTEESKKDHYNGLTPYRFEDLEETEEETNEI